MRIYYIDGICGAGKTESLLDYCANWINEKRILLVQPTKKLIEQTKTRFVEKYGLTMTAITSDTTDNVNKDFAKFCSSWKSGIVVITHVAFMQLPQNWKNKSDVEVFIDEIPQPDWSSTLNVPVSMRFFKDMLRVETDPDISNYSRVHMEPGYTADVTDEWQRYGKNDDMLKTGLLDLTYKLTSEYWDVFISKNSWNKINLRVLQDEVADYGKLNFHGMLKQNVFEGFKQVHIMGANFKESLLYKVFSEKATFIPFTEFKLQTVHNDDLGRRLRLYYCADRWSNKLLNSIDKNNPFSKFDNAITEIFGDSKFIWTANNRFDDDVVDFKNAVRIPNIVHGMNEWMGIHGVMFLTAINCPPTHYHFMEEVFNVDSDDYKKAQAYEIAYQTIMRTSLRNPDSTNEVRAFVGELDMGQYLQKLFPKSKLHHVETNESKFGNSGAKRGRPVKEKKLTPQELKIKYKEKKKKIDSSMKAVSGIFNSIIDIPFKIPSDATDSVRFEPHITYEMSVFSKELIEEKHTGWTDFLNLLREAKEAEYVSKDANLLMSMAKFDDRHKVATDPEEVVKGLANVEYMSGMLLDFDGSQLKPQDIDLILEDIKWVIYNSASNGSKKKTGLCYRVFIPFYRPCSTDMYSELFDIISKKIEAAGYYVGQPREWEKRPFSGLDKSKRPSNSFFYLPCVPQTKLSKDKIWIEHWEGYSFFDPTAYINQIIPDPVEYNEVEAQTNASPLLVKLQEMIKNPPSSVTHPDPLAAEKKRLKAIAAVEKWWESVRDVEGQGHRNIYRLASRWHKAGLTANEARIMLPHEASKMKSPGHRKTDAKNHLKEFWGI